MIFETMRDNYAISLSLHQQHWEPPPPTSGCTFLHGIKPYKIKGLLWLFLFLAISELCSTSHNF